MRRAGILLLLLLPAQAATLWALPDCSRAVASVCRMGPDGEPCCPAGECSAQECGAPAPEAVFVTMPSLPPVAAVVLPRPAASGVLSPDGLSAPPAPTLEILDPPPRG
ncbi:MAG TPA: hypothetical protein VKH43_02165 [Thermoanaerobaculia bacterium]|nr:hypothetical protein [Thermoanaerobaculia bacterium]